MENVGALLDDALHCNLFVSIILKVFPGYEYLNTSFLQCHTFQLSLVNKFCFNVIGAEKLQLTNWEAKIISIRSIYKMFFGIFKNE